MNDASKDEHREMVRDNYGKVADAGGGCGCQAGASCCSPAAEPAGKPDLGYSEDELAAAPAGADMGLGCGNPGAIAGIKPGETVLDLGCGAGFDCFIAAGKTGEGGRVIGVDMTPEMLAKARSNAGKSGLENVEFRLGEIEHLPVADGSVDVIISNCVINLSPDKAGVFSEAARVLKSGGRLSISDIVAMRPLPEGLKNDPAAVCSCIGGAATVGELEAALSAAGFTDIKVTPLPGSGAMVEAWVPGLELDGAVFSATIEAVKP